MMSIDLLKAVMSTDQLTAMDISTHGIFQTQFHDKFRGGECDNLEFPSQHSSLFHPVRDGNGPYVGRGRGEDTDCEEDGDCSDAENEDAHTRKSILKLRAAIAKHRDGDEVLCVEAVGP